jgi:hypothetical protein
MRYRTGVVAALVLAGILLFFWDPFTSNPVGPVPLLPPPTIPEAVASPPANDSFGTADALPRQLSDDSFWRMISEFSEPGGSFMYENFLSNEKSYQDPIRLLTKIAKPGGVYLGVGPEQNFTYMAALLPRMAFIIDIRRQNMLELLMYKALFEMAANRADFVSLLFSRRRPNGLDERSTADELFKAYGAIQPDGQLFQENLHHVKQQLTGSHRLPLAADDLNTIEYVYRVFFSMGPQLNYASVSPGPSGPSYEKLMTLTDRNGHNWSYLATEASFRFVKELQQRNLIVPIVGDFAGPKAVRAVGRYLKDHNAVVSAFYLSNVEMYILPSQQWKSFCMNVATLPVDTSSSFIRFVLPGFVQGLPFGTSYASVSVTSPMIDVLTGVAKTYPSGYSPSYYDLLHDSR